MCLLQLKATGCHGGEGISLDVSHSREINVVTLIHFHIPLLCPCKMFWRLTKFCAEFIESNPDPASAEEEMESKHLKEARRDIGLLLSQGSPVQD